MLTVDQYAYIRIARRVYGKKIREMARDTGHSRNTVKKALRGEYEGYSERGRQPFPVLGPYLAIIDGWLKEDLDRPRKQRHTAVRTYKRLRREHGFGKMGRWFKRFISKLKRVKSSLFGNFFVDSKMGTN